MHSKSVLNLIYCYYRVTYNQACSKNKNKQQRPRHNNRLTELKINFLQMYVEQKMIVRHQLQRGIALLIPSVIERSNYRNQWCLYKYHIYSRITLLHYYTIALKWIQFVAMIGGVIHPWIFPVTLVIGVPLKNKVKHQ